MLKISTFMFCFQPNDGFAPKQLQLKQNKTQLLLTKRLSILVAKNLGINEGYCTKQ